MTWCISRSKLIPKWQNIFALVSDPIVIYLGAIAISTSAILSYIQGAFEEWKYDYCTMFAKVMQILVSTTAKLNIKTVGTRFILVFQLWGSMLAFITVVTFTTVIVQRSIYSYQIHTVRELIDKDFQLAGDANAWYYLNKQQPVRPMREEWEYFFTKTKIHSEVTNCYAPTPCTRFMSLL